ncbi:hypothetical protein IG631_10148 [Alternaria alternata]|nr:hypothetical protein IG631_10148 [Alternaria alternata]
MGGCLDLKITMLIQSARQQLQSKARLMIGDVDTRKQMPESQRLGQGTTYKRESCVHVF